MKYIYTDKLWKQYVEKIEDDFKLKTYPQFDPYFNFLSDKEKIKSIVADSSFKNMKNHDFIPFLKTLQKTPRYRYQNEKDNYALETKIRPISFASHFDTYIYGFYAYGLNKIYQDYIHQNGFQEIVLAYRSDLDGKCNIQFAKEAFNRVRSAYKENDECSVIALDIKGYFDNINHAILKKMWCKVIGEKELPMDQYKIFRSLTKYSYINYISFLKHFKINLKKLEKEQRKKYKEEKKVPRGYQSLFDLIPNDVNGSSFHEKMELLRKRKLVTVNSEVEKNQRNAL